MASVVLYVQEAFAHVMGSGVNVGAGYGRPPPCMPVASVCWRETAARWYAAAMYGLTPRSIVMRVIANPVESIVTAMSAMRATYARVPASMAFYGAPLGSGTRPGRATCEPGSGAFTDSSPDTLIRPESLRPGSGV